MVAAVAGCVATAALTSLATKTDAKVGRATSSRPDAELLELGAKFDEAYASWVPVLLKWRELNAAFRKKYSREYPGDDPELRNYWALYEDDPSKAASEANDAALDVCCDLSNLIREIPATTIAGLAVKARLVRFDSFSPWEFIPADGMDWGPKVFHDFMAEIDRLATGTVFDLQNKVAAIAIDRGNAAAVDWFSLWKRFCEADAKHAAACDLLDDRYPESREAVDVAASAMDEAIDTIVKTPSSGVDGIAVKLALLHRHEECSGGFLDDLRISAMRDAERLSGLILPHPWKEV